MKRNEVITINDKEEQKEFIRKKYGEIASNATAGGCCCSGTSCCNGDTSNVDQTSARLGYSQSDLKDIPSEANMGLGCGNPIAIAGLREGEVVLDLGSGGGIDCFLARKQVGKSGYVIGVDMTPEMIKLARQNAKKAGYTNVEFRRGEIEHLPVADQSVDVIISNCVINLSPDKQQVFNEAYQVLKPGGRLSISDVVATAELPDEVKMDPAMLAGCISGAEYVEDLRIMLENAGFRNIRLTPKDNSKEIISSWVPGKNIEDFVASFIIQAEK